MAWGFKKRLKIAPGIHLNVGKTGVSTRIGPRGAGVTLGKQGIHASATAPGTGLSVRKRIGAPQPGQMQDAEPATDMPAKSSGKVFLIILGIIGAAFSLLMILGAILPGTP